MTDYTSIRIKKEIAEKIQLIKIQNNCKSLNETLEQLIPKTVNENYEFINIHNKQHPYNIHRPKKQQYRQNMGK